MEAMRRWLALGLLVLGLGGLPGVGGAQRAETSYQGRPMLRAETSYDAMPRFRAGETGYDVAATLPRPEIGLLLQAGDGEQLESAARALQEAVVALTGLPLGVPADFRTEVPDQLSELQAAGAERFILLAPDGGESIVRFVTTARAVQLPLLPVVDSPLEIPVRQVFSPMLATLLVQMNGDGVLAEGSVAVCNPGGRWSERIEALRAISTLTGIAAELVAYDPLANELPAGSGPGVLFLTEREAFNHGEAAREAKPDGVFYMLAADPRRSQMMVARNQVQTAVHPNYARMVEVILGEFTEPGEEPLVVAPTVVQTAPQPRAVGP